ncbi:MAG TPA: hypothetical protein VMT21_00040 [Gemmatimonadales bacterium]|nr:hypothetical protein [Gemmatimonadales bacterium]
MAQPSLPAGPHVADFGTPPPPAAASTGREGWSATAPRSGHAHAEGGAAEPAARADGDGAPSADRGFKTEPGAHDVVASAVPRPPAAPAGTRAAAESAAASDVPRVGADPTPQPAAANPGTHTATAVVAAGMQIGSAPPLVRDNAGRRSAAGAAPPQPRELPGPPAARPAPAARVPAVENIARGARRPIDKQQGPVGPASLSSPAAHSGDGGNAAAQSGSAPVPAPTGARAAPASPTADPGFAPTARASASAPQQADASAEPRPQLPGSVTLRVSDPEGGSTRVRVDVRGDAVRARIVPQSTPLAAQLTADVGDANAALQRQGFATAHVVVRTPPATPVGGAAPVQPAEPPIVPSVGRSMDAPPNPRQPGHDAGQETARDPANWQGSRSHHRSTRERER